MPEPQAADIPSLPVDDEALIPLGEVAAALHCTLGRAEELVKRQALLARWERRLGYAEPEWLCRLADVRAYRKWLADAPPDSPRVWPR